MAETCRWGKKCVSTSATIYIITFDYFRKKKLYTEAIIIKIKKTIVAWKVGLAVALYIRTREMIGLNFGPRYWIF
jgi:hypothetical protein